MSIKERNNLNRSKKSIVLPTLLCRCRILVTTHSWSLSVNLAQSYRLLPAWQSLGVSKHTAAVMLAVMGTMGPQARKAPTLNKKAFHQMSGIPFKLRETIEMPSTEADRCLDHVVSNRHWQRGALSFKSMFSWFCFAIN